LSYNYTYKQPYISIYRIITKKIKGCEMIENVMLSEGTEREPQ